MEKGWNEFQAYLNTLTEAQMTGPTDAAGWTVKDHLVHLTVWEDGMNAVFEKTSRRERMGLDEATWASDDYDQQNAVIQQQHKSKSVAEVRRMFEEAHNRLVANIKRLANADLVRPYRYYQPDSTAEHPVYANVVGNSYGHYEEHQPWIEAIVAK
jgi:uncharacterized protein (TIGR03083 family)